MSLHCIYAWTVFFVNDLRSDSAKKMALGVPAVLAPKPRQSRELIRLAACRRKKSNTPAARLITAAFFAAGADFVHQVNQGQEHRKDDAADDDGQKDDHDRFEERSHGRDRVINFLVVVVGDLEEHFG